MYIRLPIRFIYVYMNTNIYIYLFIYMYMYVCIYIYICICTYIIVSLLILYYIYIMSDHCFVCGVQRNCGSSRQFTMCCTHQKFTRFSSSIFIL